MALHVLFVWARMQDGKWPLGPIRVRIPVEQLLSVPSRLRQSPGTEVETRSPPAPTHIKVYPYVQAPQRIWRLHLA